MARRPTLLRAVCLLAHYRPSQIDVRHAKAERAIINDPLFLDEQTLVFPVPSIAALEETSHCSFLLETRFDEAELAARMMLAGARSLPSLPAGAHSLLDLPPGALWGEQRTVAEKEWL